MAVNAKILTRVLYRAATTLPHYGFVLLSKYSSSVEICRFSKVEDACGSCVSLGVQVSL